VPLPHDFVDHITSVMDAQHFSFVEINPLIVRNDRCFLLDAAVLADSAGEYVADWTEDDVVDPHVPSDSEAAIAEMNQNSPAAFSFRVLNPNGALWLILSGGGASITIADEAMNQGKADLIGNYGEYSGGPTTEESYLYTKHVLEQTFRSNAPKKAIVIAGGVANFTDVKKTFKGVIQALDEVADKLREAQVTVFVRRGGPNENEGLAMMKQFLENNQLLGSVHGSDILLTDVVTEALEYVDA
jgi:succinyl-CoA synthetase beta subunit